MFSLNTVYLNTAYVGPMPLRAKENVERMLERCMDPSSMTYEQWFKFTDQVRARFARLLGVKDDSIAFSTSVSELVSHVANGLDLTTGDEILLLEEDYPSMVLPWLLRAEQKGFRVRHLPATTFRDPDRLSKEITKRTKLIGCSHVKFNTGEKFPINDIGRICQEHSVLFLADTSQSLGGMRVSPQNVDILVGVAYKWLLGPYGSAYGYFSENALRAVKRTHASWLASPNSRTTESLLAYTTDTLPGARMFDRGEAPSFLITAALMGSLDLILDQSLEKIELHNRALTRRFLEAMKLPTADHSNIVCFQAKGDPMEVKNKLAAQNIEVSVREGRLRAAFHFFNTEAHVDALSAALN